MKQPYKLKTNYGELNGYSDEAQDRKDQFLHDAKRLLVEAGKYLASAGLSDSQVSVNQAGIAVSGDVWAHFWNANDPGFCITCFITASVLGVRPDHVMITARKDEWKERPGRKKKATWSAGRMGVNRDIPTALDSRALTDVLEQIFLTGDYIRREHKIEALRPPFLIEVEAQQEAAPEMVQLSLFETEMAI